MLETYRTSIDRALGEYLSELDRAYSLRAVAPDLFEGIRRCTLSGGKRIRPLLFLIAYEGYSGRPYNKAMPAAVALELFHNFALIHDDLVDGTPLRRGDPALQAWFAQQPRGRNEPIGRALALLAGDVLFCAAMDAFLSLPVPLERKQAALQELMRTAIHTGTGAFLEVVVRNRPLAAVDRAVITRIHGSKTARYTFQCPLMLGGLLAGIPATELDRLSEYGRLLGHAYQMADDLLDLNRFLAGDETGASLLFCETKVMLPIWYAFRRTDSKTRAWLQGLYERDRVSQEDKRTLKELLASTSAGDWSESEGRALLRRAEGLGASLNLEEKSRELLRRSVRNFFQPAVVVQEGSA
ncbi:MAG: polyprenyl synthetase family protein [Planctomycetota bacterium]